MDDKFKAIVLNQSGEKFSREIKTLDESFFKSGDVLVKVDYSGLNYKDALILNNGAKLIKEYPHIPGIDFSGQVKESDNADSKCDYQPFGTFQIHSNIPGDNNTTCRHTQCLREK